MSLSTAPPQSGPGGALLVPQHYGILTDRELAIRGRWVPTHDKATTPGAGKDHLLLLSTEQR